MNIPNFLIAGMAKCGTSSLASYLGQHPDIYISPKKEPRYFTSQNTEIYPLRGPKDERLMKWYVTDRGQYFDLFESAKEKAIGEASADTAYFHKYSVPLIKKELGDPKIILIIRNPVERSFSAYKHLIRDGRENLEISEAFERENERIEDNWELIYHYKKASLYYEAISAFLQNFTRVKVVLNEQLLANPNQVLRECFEFLGVDQEFTANTSIRYNVSGKPHSRRLMFLIKRESAFKKVFMLVFKLMIPSANKRAKLKSYLLNKNLKRIEINQHVKTEMYKYFEDDIRKTGTLLDKDLLSFFNFHPYLVKD